MSQEIKESLGTHITNTAEETSDRIERVIEQHFEELKAMNQEKDNKIQQLEQIIAGYQEQVLQVSYLKGQLESELRHRHEHNQIFHGPQSKDEKHHEQEEKKAGEVSEEGWANLFNQKANDQSSRRQTMAKPVTKQLVT